MGDGFADVVEEIQERPVTGKTDADDSRGDHDFRGDFDQAASPSAGVAFAERIVCAAAVVIAFAFASCQGRDGQFGGRFGLWWLGDVLPQTDQQIVGRRVQVKSKQIGHVAMIAQPIRTETAFEFLVAILTLAAFGVLIVGRFGEDVGSESIRDHRAPVGALRVGLTFDDRKSRMIPGGSLIPKRVE